MRFVYDDMSAGYPDLVEKVKRYGRRRSPRGQGTFEVPNATIVLENPRRSHPEGCGRRYGRAIAAAEALSLVGGVSDPVLMTEVGSNFKRFLDGGALHGAYGPRVRAQLPQVVEKIREDRDTRQAILTVWDPRYDMAGWTPVDLPCTLGFGFAVFDDKLEMTTTMRSNDVWWGVAHDLPMFTALHLTVASALGLEPGPYTHQAYSLHLYDRDLEAAEEQLADRAPVTPPVPAGGGLYSEGGIEQGMRRARDILAGDWPSMPTPQEQWYIDVLRPHVDSLASEGRNFNA